MMKDCEIIQDLLPLYAEGVASKSTSDLIEHHLLSCETCNTALEQMRQTICIPAQTDVDELVYFNKKRIRRNFSAVLAVIFLLLTLFHCLLICYTVPIWLTVDEAITDIQDLGNGSIKLVLSDRAGATYRIGSGFFMSGMRLQQQRRNIPEANQRIVSASDTLWYAGSITRDGNTLLCGDGSTQPELTETDQTLEILFYCALCAGFFCVVFGIRNWRGKYVFRMIALILLCFAGACLFVTAGRFTVVTMGDMSNVLLGKMGMLSERLLHISILTTFSFCMFVSGFEWIKLWLSEIRRSNYEG